LEAGNKDGVDKRAHLLLRRREEGRSDGFDLRAKVDNSAIKGSVIGTGNRRSTGNSTGNRRSTGNSTGNRRRRSTGNRSTGKRRAILLGERKRTLSPLRGVELLRRRGIRRGIRSKINDVRGRRRRRRSRRRRMSVRMKTEVNKGLMGLLDMTRRGLRGLVGVTGRGRNNKIKKGFFRGGRRRRRRRKRFQVQIIKRGSVRRRRVEGTLALVETRRTASATHSSSKNNKRRER